MQGARRHKIGLPTEQLGQLIGEVLDVPSQPTPRQQRLQHVDVAVGPLLAADPRAEDLQLGDTVPVMIAARRTSSASIPGLIIMARG
jgi:hypothetical protein